MKCYYCSEPPAKDKKLCERHAEKKRKDQKRIRKQRQAKGLCTQCGAERDVRDRVKCSRCINKQKETYNKRVEKRKSENCCTMCGRSKSYISAWDYSLCPRCHLRDKFKWQGTIEEAENIINSLLEGQNHRCVLTGKDLHEHKFHIDHIIPRSLDSSQIAEPSNWQIIVADANLFKKDRTTKDVLEISKSIVKYAIETGTLSIDDLIE